MYYITALKKQQVSVGETVTHRSIRVWALMRTESQATAPYATTSIHPSVRARDSATGETKNRYWGATTDYLEKFSGAPLANDVRSVYINAFSRARNGWRIYVCLRQRSFLRKDFNIEGRKHLWGRGGLERVLF